MKTQRKIILVAHNLRSCHNVGSLLRTAEGLGVHNVLLTGYTPYPEVAGDTRLPHEARKLDAQIHKTALGAEKHVSWEHADDIQIVLAKLKDEGFKIYALEQAAGAVRLPDFNPPEKLAVIVGREVEGIESEVMAVTDEVLEIPMSGQKESFNVVQAAAMALYHVTFSP